MNYWIFKVNPDDYDIDGHLAYHDKRISWRVQNHQKKNKAKDVAFIWRTGSNRGIIGMMDIDSDPSMKKIFEHEHQETKKLQFVI